MLRIDGLVKRNGERTVVDQLHLQVSGGEIYALLGPNGATKSTTTACVLGFIHPDTGGIRLADSELPSTEAGSRHAAYISENVALYERLTGIENAEFFMHLSGRKPRRHEIEALLEHTDLPPEAWGCQAHSYSKSMRQKVGIVMALDKEASLLVLDEPTCGLDSEASVAFGGLIRELEDQGTAVLMATHDLFCAQELAKCCGMLVASHLDGEWTVDALHAGELECTYLATPAGPPA